MNNHLIPHTNLDSKNIPSPGACVKTTCPYCGVGCGVEVDVSQSDVVKVKGDEQHPANLGRLCSKGSALGETLGLDKRLLTPKVDGKEVSWDLALDKVANGFNDIIKTHGREAIGFYVSGQILTEDYYVANKLIKGFIGNANIDTNSRLCMSSAVVGHKRAFGSDTVACQYTDLEQADLLVLIGSNTAWCHPVLYQRIVVAKQRRPHMQVVVIDPRKTSTSDIADLHLALNPGADTILFNGLLSYLAEQGCIDEAFVTAYCDGFDEALSQANAYSDSVKVAAETGLDHDELMDFYRRFAQTEKTVSLYSQGVNQSSAGSDKCNSIINLHLATGRIAKEGAGPFSITGQPNAMGGREVGGLANQLAAHMDFHKPEHIDLVQRFWQAPNMASKEGLKALELFDAIDKGKVKALWVMATNPLVSLPDADRMRAILAKCELVVVSECVEQTDTSVFADVLLPATTWGEKEGTVTNSERTISRQRAFKLPPGQARHDWQIICDVAKRMGFDEGFNYQSQVEIFREHAALSAFENSSQGQLRDFNLAAVEHISQLDYDNWLPKQWPLAHAEATAAPRIFSDGLFFTPNRKAKFIAIKPKACAYQPDANFPLVLNTGRIRDQWHTMTRTGNASRLTAHIHEPMVEMHPQDAQIYGVQEGEIAQVSSQWGQVRVRVAMSSLQTPGQVFVPIHWSDQFSSQARIGAVCNPACDPLSGQPEFKHTPVKVEPVAVAQYGFILLTPSMEDVVAQFMQMEANYFAKSAVSQGLRYEFSLAQTLENLPQLLHKLAALLEQNWAGFELLEYSDQAQEQYRFALIKAGKLVLTGFLSRDCVLPNRQWLASLLNQELDASTRLALLSGKSADPSLDVGEIVCACFSVGKNTLCQAIEKQGLNSVEALGQSLKAGTNCGSCVPELRKLLA